MTMRSALTIAAIAAMLQAANAAAQTHDANCNPRDYTADEKLPMELCTGHAGCRLTMLAQTACKAKDFLGNLTNKLTGRTRIDNWDVIDALNETEVPQTPGVRKTNEDAKRPYYVSKLRIPSYDRTNAAQVDWQQAFYGPPADAGAKTTFMLRANGSPNWFEGEGSFHPSEKLVRGGGTQIDAEGNIVAGYTGWDSSTRSVQMTNAGLRRDSNGAWQAGSFISGQLNGSGYTTPGDRSGTVMEGTFLNGLADGMMLVTWPDGSSRKELWKNGKLVTAGAKVPKGQFPPAPKTPEQLAAEQRAAEQAAAAARERAFNAELAAAPNAAVLYALADEWAEKGDMPKANAIWRTLLRRFPNSPLAERAAGRLSPGGSATGQSTRSAAASGARCAFNADESRTYPGGKTALELMYYSSYQPDMTSCDVRFAITAVARCDAERGALAANIRRANAESESYQVAFGALKAVIKSSRNYPVSAFVDAVSQERRAAAFVSGSEHDAAAQSSSALRACLYQVLVDEMSSGRFPPAG